MPFFLTDEYQNLLNVQREQLAEQMKDQPGKKAGFSVGLYKS